MLPNSKNWDLTITKLQKHLFQFYIKNNTFTNNLILFTSPWIIEWMRFLLKIFQLIEAKWQLWYKTAISQNNTLILNKRVLDRFRTKSPVEFTLKSIHLFVIPNSILKQTFYLQIEDKPVTRMRILSAAAMESRDYSFNRIRRDYGKCRRQIIRRQVKRTNAVFLPYLGLIFRFPIHTTPPPSFITC